MPRRRTPLPPSLGTAFTTSDAAVLGVTRKRLAGRDLDAPFHGVRARPLEVLEDEHPNATWRRDIRRLSLACHARLPAHAFLCGATAAVWWGLPIDPPPPDADDDGTDHDRFTMHVGVLHPHRPVRIAGVRAHQLRPHLATITERGGVRVTSAASTWASLAGTLTVRELVVVGDAVARIPRKPGGWGRPPGPPLATLAQLDAAVSAGRRPAIAKLRAALPLLRTGSSSPRETELRLLLLDERLPEPALDFDVYDEHGRFLGCSELAYPDSKVAVEYEGDHHRTSPAQWRRDIDKYQAYADAGWTVIRIMRDHLATQPREVAARVRRALIRAGWTP